MKRRGLRQTKGVQPPRSLPPPLLLWRALWQTWLRFANNNGRTAPARARVGAGALPAGGREVEFDHCRVVVQSRSMQIRPSAAT